MKIEPELYKAKARKAVNNSVLQSALAGLQERLGRGTALSYQRLPEGPELRLKANDIRMHAIEHLDILLETLADNVRQNGGHVFFAEDGQAAVSHCLEIAGKYKIKKIVKGKSMVTEEIGLNSALERAGLSVTETDLGEYIVQLAGETPSHIIAPAIHRTRNQIGELFADKLGISYTDDPPVLTQAARKALRKKFISADMGISGCNLACSETGHIAVVSNEGNIRMSTTLPRVHVAFMGMERIAACLEDYDILFRLLSRGAAAQNIAGYVSYLGGPKTDDQIDGPEAFYLIIIDNGRSRILADNDFREILCCIRCAACLNVCPVYAKIGGHTYGSPYSGPIGAVITPLLFGMNQAKDLYCGETLCGACKDACPINIDIPGMLITLRKKLAEGDKKWNVKRTNIVERVTFKIWALAVKNKKVYDFFLRMFVFVQKFLTGNDGMIHKLPFPFAGWTKSRNIRPISSKRFTSGSKKKR